MTKIELLYYIKMGKIFVNSADLITALYRNKQTEIAIYSYNNETIYVKGGSTIELGEELEFVMDATVDTDETDPFKSNNLGIFYNENCLIVSFVEEGEKRSHSVRSCELVVLTNLKHQENNNTDIQKWIEDKKEIYIDEYNKIQMELYQEYKKRQYRKKI